MKARKRVLPTSFLDKRTRDRSQASCGEVCFGTEAVAAEDRALICSLACSSAGSHTPTRRSTFYIIVLSSYVCIRLKGVLQNNARTLTTMLDVLNLF